MIGAFYVIKALQRAFFSVILMSLPLWSIELSSEEKEYLAKLGTVKVCVDPDWAPFEMMDKDGSYRGIGADLLKMVMTRLDIPFSVVLTKDWDESLAFSKEGKCHIMSFLNQTPSRDKWLLFTSPHFSDPNVFITREEHPFIANPHELINETIVFPVGTAMEERIRKEYPNLRVILSSSEMEAFEMVASKKADIAMRSLIVAAYTIKQKGLFTLKIAGQLPDYTNQLRMGILRTEPMLRDILEKGVQSITHEDRAVIVNKYVAIKAQTVSDYQMVYKVIFCFAIGGLFILWRFRELKKHNKELRYLAETDLLTSIYNRTKMEQELLTYVNVSLKDKTPFAILLLDIDHFKAVNDTFGHPMGDRILQEMVQTIQHSIRKHDILGRWGGEEFLIICPQTSLDEACFIAKRIHEVIQTTLFSTNQYHTMSIGVASLSNEDTPYSLVTKADNALYQAKNGGRNSVKCFA